MLSLLFSYRVGILMGFSIKLLLFIERVVQSLTGAILLHFYQTRIMYKCI